MGLKRLIKSLKNKAFVLKLFLKKEFPGKQIYKAGEGVSSIAFEVGDKIIRFSKRSIENYRLEATVINFIRDKIKFELPNITIVENNRHSYSIHKKLHGKEWHIGLIDKASTKQKNAFIKSVATFMADLHQVNVKQAIKKCPSLKEKQWPLRTLDDMLIGFKKYFFDEEIKELHTEYTRIIYRKRSAPLTLLHGDFGSGNCRLNTTAALKCVFDFGNAVLGEPELDLIWLYQP